MYDAQRITHGVITSYSIHYTKLYEHALLGELQYSVAAKLLEELGTGEKLPPAEEDRRIVIVLEDKEGWGA